MNYQLLCKAPTNYQFDQNRAFNYQTQLFSPLPSIRGLKQTVNGSYAVLHGGMLEDGGRSCGHVGRWWQFMREKYEENEGKTACDGQVTR
jgi:hypothetical protein